MTMAAISNRNSRRIPMGLLGVFVAVLMSPPVNAQNVMSTFTFADVSIKEFQNKKFPGSVANDRKVPWVRWAAISGTARRTRAMSFGCSLTVVPTG